MHVLLLEPVDHLDMIEVYDNAPGCPAWNFSHFVGLHGYLDIFKGREHGKLEMIAWLSDRI